MLRELICPSSGVCDYVVELPHWLISFLACCVLELGCGSPRVVYGLPAARIKLLKLYNQFYMNMLYEIVCKNVHTFMKKNIWILLANFR